MNPPNEKNRIIEALFRGNSFNDCIGKMEPAGLREDLKQEVMVVVCELPEEKVIKLHRDRVLEFYVVRVIINMIRSRVSPFAKKYRTHHIELTDREVAEESDLEGRELKEQLEDLALAEIPNLYWYDAKLISLYMDLGSFRAIEQATRIPHVSCYKTIKKSFAELKRLAVDPAARPVSNTQTLRV